MAVESGSVESGMSSALSSVNLPPLTSRYLEPEIETMSRSQLRALQEDRLLELLPYAYSRSALLQDSWKTAGVHPDDIESIGDFEEQAPILDKDDVRAFRDRYGDPFGGLLCAGPAGLKVLGTTSGTTGDPTPIPQEPIGPLVRGISRDLWEAGARPGDTVLFSMFTFRSGHAIERFEQIGVVPIYLDHSDSPGLILEAAERFRPKIHYVLNNITIAAIADYADQHGIDPAISYGSVNSAMFGGEPMSERSARLLSEWGMRAHEMTSLGDVTASIECAEGAGYHAWEDLVLTEHLDPATGQSAPDGGSGELVVTSLTERAAPLVRYRSGDLVKLTRKMCACGRTHARLKVLGRQSDAVMIDGRSILPIDIWPHIEAVPAVADALFQVIRPQAVCERLTLRVGTGDPADSSVAVDVAESVGAALGVPVDVELVEREALLRLGPPHKIPRVAAS
jgi:phenylacetate-CoA ligase